MVEIFYLSVYVVIIVCIVRRIMNLTIYHSYSRKKKRTFIMFRFACSQRY